MNSKPNLGSDPVKEVKARPARGDFDPPEHRDDCVRCDGRNGGVPGNENIVDGSPVCDYCMDNIHPGRVR